MIRIKKDECIGCGLCPGLCSDIFIMGDDYKAEVISQENIECANQAAAACPVKAIIIS